MIDRSFPRYKCKECQIDLFHDLSGIEAHMESHPKMTLESYSQKHETTSISSPPRMPGTKPMARGDAETKAKIAALRESLKTTTKLNDSENNRAPRLPTATTVTSVESPASARKKAPIRPGVILPDDDSDLEGDDDAIESIDAIADFISSSEPVRPKGKVAGAASNPVPACDVTDEFTADTVLSRF